MKTPLWKNPNVILFLVSSVIVLIVTTHIRITQGIAPAALVWASIVGFMGSMVLISHIRQEYKVHCFRTEKGYE